MKTAALIAALLTAATVSFAAVPPIVYDIEANFQQTQELADQDFVQGAGVSLRYRLKSGGKWLSLTGLGARWDGRSSATSTQAVQAVATVVTSTTPHYFQITLDSTQTGSAVTNWVYSLIVTDGGIDYPIGVGDLDIAASTWTGPSAKLIGQVSVDFASVTNYSNTAASGPYVFGSGFVFTTNANGSLTILTSAMTPAWGDVTSKPFTNLVDLTILTLTGIDWSLYVTGTPWTAVGYLTDFSTMTTNDITAAGGVVTNGTEYLLIKSQAAAALPSTFTNILGTAAFTDSTNYPTLAGENVFTGATNTFDIAGNGVFKMLIGDFAGVYGLGWSAVNNVASVFNFSGFSYQGTSVLLLSDRQLLGNWTTTGNHTVASNLTVTGAATVGDLTAEDIFTKSTTPAFVMIDTDGDGSNNGSIVGNLSVTNSGAEDFDVAFYQHIDGFLVPWLVSVASGDISFDTDRTLNTGPLDVTGALDVTGQVTAGSYAAETTPYTIPWSSTIAIASSNGIEQAITNMTGSCDITLPAGYATKLTRIALMVPPVGTNVVTLPAWPSYNYVPPLTDSVSTNNNTLVYFVSAYGTTNATVTLMEIAQ